MVSETLRDKIYEAMVENSLDRRRYLPAGSLKATITKSVVSHCLMAPSPQLIDYVIQKARKLFAIAVSIGQGAKKLQYTVEIICSSELEDKDLPISIPDVMQKFPKWRRYYAHAFCEFQWALLAPVFTDHAFEYTVEPNCILPFIGTEMSPGASGGSSSVSKVILDRSHHNGIFKVQ